MLPQSIKQELISQILKGKSINFISRSLGLGKSTIYYHYKKTRGKKYLPPRFTKGTTEREGEIVGIFTGDGSQYFEPKKHSYEVNVHFGGHKSAYALYVKQLFENYFHKKFRLRKEKSGVFRLRTQSKAIFHYFFDYLAYNPRIKHCTVFLRSLALSAEFKKGFLRGLVDTDGSVLFNKLTRRCFLVVYYTTSQMLATQIHYLLNEFGILSSICVSHQKQYKPVYQVRVLSRCIDTFLKTVQPFKAMRASGSIRQNAPLAAGRLRVQISAGPL